MVAMSLPVHWLNSSRISKRTAINNLILHTLGDINPPGSFKASGRVILITMLMVFLSGCASIRPIVKIGLIAPFEGLYRQSGYDALDAMRQAMAECTPAGVDV